MDIDDRIELAALKEQVDSLERRVFGPTRQPAPTTGEHVEDVGRRIAWLERDACWKSWLILAIVGCLLFHSWLFHLAAKTQRGQLEIIRKLVER